MTTEPPLLYFSGVAADRVLVEHLADRLTARGLQVAAGGELGEPRPIETRQQIIAQADLVLVVASRAGLRSSVVAADYRFALAQARRVIPLIVEPLRRLPAELGDIQGLDFRQGEAAGWFSLLVALDALSLARYPAPSPPQLDGEVAAARTIAGLVPPDWSVSRSYAPGRRRLSRETLYGSTMTILLAVVTFLATGHNPVVLAVAGYVILLLYLRFSPRVRRAEKDGRLVIQTPEGIAVRTRTGVVWASFHEATSPVGGAVSADSVTLVMHAGQAPRTVTMPLSHLLGRGVLADDALRKYRAYVARYGSSAALAVALDSASMPEEAAPPLIFISYARQDSGLVDRLELSLRTAGYNPWVDRGNLLAGREWPPELRQALDRCAAMIVAISPHAIRSEAVRLEYTTALHAGKPVIGALVRTTRRIPPELRTRVRSDHRETLLLGTFDLVRALDALGIHAAQPYAMLPGARLPENSMLSVARVLHGEGVSGAMVYRGHLPARLWLSAAALLLVAALCVMLWAASGSLYLAYIAALAILGIGPALALRIRRRLRYPDIVVVRPEGYITFLGSAQVLEHPFSTLEALQMGRSHLMRGTPLVNMGIGRTEGYPIWIPACIRHHRRVAAEIATAFAKYAERRPASAAASAFAPLDRDELMMPLRVPADAHGTPDELSAP